MHRITILTTQPSADFEPFSHGEIKFEGRVRQRGVIWGVAPVRNFGIFRLSVPSRVSNDRSR